MATLSPLKWRWPMQHNNPSSSFYFSSSISVYPFIKQHSSFILLHNRHHHHLPPLSCFGAGPNNATTKVTESDEKLQIREIPVNDGVSASKTSKKRQNLNYKSILRRESWRTIRFPSKKLRGVLLLNLVALLYASNIPVLKEVEAVVNPAAFTAVRFSVAAIPFLPYAWRAWGDVQILHSGIELGLWASLGYLMQAFGLLTSDAGRASFISMFTVIVVPLIDGMLGAVIPPRIWFGALMSIIGVGMLECSGSPPCVGDLFNFLSALFFGIHMLRTEHISRKTNKGNFLPVLGYEVCVVALSSVIWYLIGGVIDGSLEYHPSSWTWAMLLNRIMESPWIAGLYTGVFSTGLCLWIEMTSMRDVSATEAAIIYGLEPVWGACFAWFLLGERWGVSGWFGAALILGGSLMVQIIGASSPSSSIKHKQEDITLVSDTKIGPSASPVQVGSRKDVSDFVKK